MTGTNEERIIQFVERELTPNEERALMDECAESDDMRSLLKQHVTLSKRIATSLSSVAIPIGVTDRVAEAVNEMRGGSPVPRGLSKTAAFSGTGAALVLIAGIMYFALRPSVQSKALPPAAEIVSQLPPLPVISQQAVVATTAVSFETGPEKTTIATHRLHNRGIHEPITAPKLAEKSTQNEPAAPKIQKKQPHYVPLGSGDIPKQ